jgi:hypothetical protein
MNPRMTLQIAQQHIADLQHSAELARRVAHTPEAPKRTPVIALRAAGTDEAGDLLRLAALDSQPPLRGDALVALVDGKLVAAISLEDARVIADPLAPTAEVRDLLHTRATQLLRRPRPRRRFRLRFA